MILLADIDIYAPIPEFNDFTTKANLSRASPTVEGAVPLQSDGVEG